MTTNNLPVREKFQIDSGDLALRGNWIGLTDEDLELIRNCKDFLAPDSDRIVAEFSQVAERYGSNRSIREEAQKAYFLQALEGKLDEDFIDRRLAAGARDAELDIQPRWNIGSYTLYFSLIFPRLAEHLKGQELAKTCAAWGKIMLFDLTLAIEGDLSEGMITRLVGAGANIGQASGELSENAGQVDKAAQEIAKAIQEIASASTKQTEAMGQTAEQMKELAGAISEVNQAAERTATTSPEGANITNSVNEGINGITPDAEVARAGQQESGFAVVADNVRALAERTAESSKEIATLVGAVQQSVRETVQAMQAGQLQEAMNDMAGVAEQLQASSTTMTESSDKVGQAVTEASPQAEEPASVDEVTARINEIDTKTDDLGKQSAIALNHNQAAPSTRVVRHMRKQQLQQFLTVQEAATLFKVKEPTIQRWCRQGQIPALKRGKSWRIRWDAAS